MQSGAFVLILSSAILNALWNVSAKKLSGRLGGIWLALVIAGAVFAPHAIVVAAHERVPAEGIRLTAITAVLNAIYFIVLCKSYEWGEVSVVYPISRGTGVIGTAVAGAWLLREHVTPLGALGIALVCLGTLVVGAGQLHAREARTALALALVNGASIAGCAIYAKWAVAIMSPEVYNWGLYAGSAVLLAPYLLARHRSDIAAAWRDARRECWLIGIGSPLSYVLALFAFRMGNVSYLGPIRECSIVIGAIFGVVALGERPSRARLLGIASITAGVVTLRLA